METNWVKNAAGRLVPTQVNGEEVIPFQGVGKYHVQGKKHAPSIPSFVDFPKDGNKVVESLKCALQNAGLKDGMIISTHHHFRDGDLVSNQIFDIAHELGVKDLHWFPSASFP